VQLIPVQSTNLAQIGYDPDTMIMQIMFKNGSLYAYSNVEPDTYNAMMTSGNPGEYFASIIKPQRYRYSFTRVS
jgi:hypothetical protein